MPLVETYKEGTQTVAYFLVEGPKEVEAYRMMLREVFPRCPTCGEDLNPPDNELRLKVYDPLQPGMLGMDLGQIRTHCPHCNAYIKVEDNELDLNAFPSVMRVLTSARNKRQVAASIPPTPTRPTPPPATPAARPAPAPSVSHVQNSVSQPVRRPVTGRSSMAKSPYYRNRGGSNGQG